MTPEPTDLAERLTAWGRLASDAGQPADAHLLLGAADEIRRLRSELAGSVLRAELAGSVAPAESETDRLRAELNRCREDHRETVRRFADTMSEFAMRMPASRPAPGAST
jgi:hypothetical protein